MEKIDCNPKKSNQKNINLNIRCYRFFYEKWKYIEYMSQVLNIYLLGYDFQNMIV